MRTNIKQLLAFLLVLLPTLAFGASIQGPRRSALERLEGGDAIRSQLLLRGGRFEVTPAVGFTIGDAYKRNLLFGGSLTYHIIDQLAVGATAFGAMGFNTDLSDRLESERPERIGAYGEDNLLVSGELTYTPIVGKFNLFGRFVFNYDTHLLAGRGAVKTSGAVDGFSVAPVVGVGIRGFLSDAISIQLQFRDYLYSSAESALSTKDTEGNSKTESDKTFSNHFAVTAGIGIFFPFTPKTSR